MKATTWFCPVLLTLLCVTRLVCTAQRGGYPLDYADPNVLQDDYLLDKRNKPSLSIVNPLDVLRQRLLLEIARRQMKENTRQVELNRAILKNVGKRMWARRPYQEQLQLEQQLQLQLLQQQRQQRQRQQQQQQQQQHQLQLQEEMQHFPRQLTLDYGVLPPPAVGAGAGATGATIYDFLQEQRRLPYMLPERMSAAAAAIGAYDDILDVTAAKNSQHGQLDITKQQQQQQQNEKGNEIGNETNHEKLNPVAAGPVAGAAAKTTTVADVRRATGSYGANGINWNEHVSGIVDNMQNANDMENETAATDADDDDDVADVADDDANEHFRMRYLYRLRNKHFAN